MKKLVIFAILLTICAAGCQSDSSKGEPVKSGDYTSEPGGAAKTK
jgi:hypothetical protein